MFSPTSFGIFDCLSMFSTSTNTLRIGSRSRTLYQLMPSSMLKSSRLDSGKGWAATIASRRLPHAPWQSDHAVLHIRLVPSGRASAVSWF